MKSIILLILTAISLTAAPLVPVPSNGPPKSNPTGKFAWDPNPEPDIAGYNLYFGTVSGTWPNKVDAGAATTAEILFPAYGTYFVVATAKNIAGQESLPSTELRVEIKHDGPQPPKMPSLGVALKTSTDLKSWTSVWASTNPAGNKAFYRIEFTNQ